MLLFMGKNACLAYVKSRFRIRGIYLNNDRYNVKMNILMFNDLIENSAVTTVFTIFGYQSL